MPSNLLIAVFGCRAFLQAHGFKNSVLTKLLFDTQQGILQPAFFGKFGFFGRLLLCQGFVIGKEIWLFLDFFRNIVLIENVVRTDSDFADQ